MNKSRKFKKKIKRFLFDHPFLKFIVEYSWALVLCLFSSFIFAFGFSAFITPGVEGGLTIITGGASGTAQIVALIFGMAGTHIPHSAVVAIAFAGINLPLIIFAFKNIGIRFSILTCINVALSAMFLIVLDPAKVEWIRNIGTSPLIADQTIDSALFAGVCTGLSSAAAFAGFFSAGGIDIVSYFFALKKSTSVGKYTLLINFCIILVFSTLNVIGSLTGNPESPLVWTDYILGLLFAVVYLAVVSIVVDLINTRNKKVRIDIITSNEKMPDILIANFPHGVTISKGVGGYSRKEKFILSIAVSSSEVKRVIQVIESCDTHAFIQVINLKQIYGNFFINPIR